MAQIRQVVSESLQATIRRLLPSQQGFTEDLQATNVITPIIDLTPTAEGSALREDLASAIAFGSQTAFAVSGASTVIINNAGFYRVFGTATLLQPSGTLGTATFTMSDGLSTKTVWDLRLEQGNANTSATVALDFVVFLDSGDSLSATTVGSNGRIQGSYRQIADLNGEIVNPSGFSSS